METKQEWVKRVLGVNVAADSASDATPAPLDATGLARKLVALKPQILDLHDPKPLLDGLQAAADLLRAGALAEASARIETLEARVTAAARGAAAAAEIAEAIPGSGGSAIDYAKARLQLSAALAARDQGALNLQQACEALLDSGAYDDHPDLKAARAAVATVGERLPDMDALADAVQDALDTLASATDAGQRQRRVKAAIAAIDLFLAELDEEPKFRELQSTPAGSWPIHGPIAAAVTGLRDLLSA